MYRMIMKFVMSLRIVMVVRYIECIGSWLAGGEINIRCSGRGKCER